VFREEGESGLVFAAETGESEGRTGRRERGRV
jgi:hypothetical protein